MADETRPGHGPEMGLLNNMVGFLRYAAEGNANIASLSGPIDVPTDFHTFVGLFPRSRKFAAVSTRNGVDRKALYEKILGLGIPGRVFGFEDLDNPSLREAHELILQLLGLPSIVLAIGETMDTGEEALYLATASGIIPRTGLSEIQAAVRKRNFT